MRNIRAGSYKSIAAAAVYLLALCALVGAARGVRNASAAELPVFTPMDSEITLNLNAERGAAFDFAALPATAVVTGHIPERKPPVKLNAAVEWNVTAESAERAARSEDFTVRGEIATAVFGDTVYAVEGGLAATVNVRFIDRSATARMTFLIRPAYKYGTDILVMTGMAAYFDEPFDWTDVTGVDLQYSFGAGWHSLPVPAAEWDQLNEANIQVDFVNEAFAYDDDPYVFSETELKRFLTDLVHFRLRLTGGLFEGYTNTVTVEGENSRVNGEENAPDGGGILPNYFNSGSRGGAVAFWTTPGGTALAVVLGISVAAVCFGGGVAVGVALYRRKKRREQDEP